MTNKKEEELAARNREISIKTKKEQNNEVHAEDSKQTTLNEFATDGEKYDNSQSIATYDTTHDIGQA